MGSRFPEQPYAWRYVMDGVCYNDSVVLGLIEEHFIPHLSNYDFLLELALQDYDEYELEGVDDIDIEGDVGEIYEHLDATYYQTNLEGQIVLIWDKYDFSGYYPLVSQLPSEILTMKELKYLHLPCSIKCIQELPDCLKENDWQQEI